MNATPHIGIVPIAQCDAIVSTFQQNDTNWKPCWVPLSPTGQNPPTHAMAIRSLSQSFVNNSLPLLGQMFPGVRVRAWNPITQPGGIQSFLDECGLQRIPQ